MEYNSYIASNNLNSGGASNTFASIQGTIQKVGKVTTAQVYLFNPLTHKTISMQSNEFGQYSFRGLPKGQSFIIFARDKTQQYNAVIQDNVIPK